MIINNKIADISSKTAPFQNFHRIQINFQRRVSIPKSCEHFKRLLRRLPRSICEIFGVGERRLVLSIILETCCIGKLMSSESESLLDEEGPSSSLLRNTNMEAQAEHAKIKRYNTIYTITTVLGVTLVVLTFLWLNHYLGGFSLAQTSTEFNWHPLLMVTGMLFLYSQSILVYRTGRNMKKFNLKCIHAGIHISIVVMAALGLKAVFDSHNYASPPIANLYSLHSWLGILTFALFVGQLLLGFTTFLYPGASKGFRAALIPYHVSLGSAGFLMAIITAGLGFAEKVMFFLGNNYQKQPLSGLILNTIGVITVIFGILTLHLVNDVQYERQENIEDEVPLSGE